MGGEWTPEYFATRMPNMWGAVSALVSEDDGSYLYSAISLSGLDKLVLREGNNRHTVQVNDEVAGIFQAIKAAGDDSAIIVNRQSKECFLTNSSACDSFMDDRVDIEDNI